VVKSAGPVSITSVYSQRWHENAVTDNQQAHSARSAMWTCVAAQIHWRRLARYRLGRQLLRQWKPLVESALRIGGQLCGLLRTIPLRQTMMGWRSRLRQRRVGRAFGGFAGAAVAAMYVAMLVAVQTWRPQAATSRAMGWSIRTSVVDAPTQAAPVQPQAVLAGTEIRPSAATAPPQPLSRAQEIAQLKAQIAQARQQALWRLRQSPQYQQAQAELERLDARVRELRVRDPYGELPQTSVKWIQAKSALNRLTEQALRTDAELRRAEEALERRRAMP
jgi:hypothetical protein